MRAPRHFRGVTDEEITVRRASSDLGRDPRRRRPLNQEFEQRGRRLSLPFGWDLLDYGLHYAL